MNVLLLDTDKASLHELQNLLSVLSVPFQQIDQATSVTNTVNYFMKGVRPDLIIADTVLSDGLSIDVFTAFQVQAPVIFCTTHAEYALASFSSNVIDYLIKPITAAKLTRSFDKLYGRSGQLIRRQDELESDVDQLVGYYGDQLEIIRIHSVQYFYRLGASVFVQTEHKRFFVRQTLDNLELSLNADLFFRANRRYLIHRKSIKRIKFFEARKLETYLHPQAEEAVIVSKDRAPSLLRWVGRRSMS